METVEEGPDEVEGTPAQLVAGRVPLTGILEELGCDGDPPPLASGDAPEVVAADQLVGHVAQAQLGHDRLHLWETKPRRLVTRGGCSFLSLREAQERPHASPSARATLSLTTREEHAYRSKTQLGSNHNLIQAAD